MQGEMHALILTGRQGHPLLLQGALLTLQQDVRQTLQQLDSAQASAAGSVAVLVEVDQVKGRMEAACKTLQVGRLLCTSPECSLAEALPSVTVGHTAGLPGWHTCWAGRTALQGGWAGEWAAFCILTAFREGCGASGGARMAVACRTGQAGWQMSALVLAANQ